LIVCALAFINLRDYPLTWFDEGSHLHVPKALVRYGVYADFSHDGFRYFGPTVGVGPTVLLPIAAVFKLFGIGLLQARVVMALYLIAASLVFFGLAHQLYGWRFAWVATALLIATRGLALLEYGRQVLGEVPGLLFMVWGLWLWFIGWERSSWRRLATAGLLLGAAMVTKSQYFIVLAPALLFAFVSNFHYRSAPWRVLLAPGVMAAMCFGAWQAYLILYLGPATAGENWRWYREAIAGAALLFSPERMGGSLLALFTPGVHFGLLLPALAYGLLHARARQRAAHQWAILLAACVFNLVWFVTASVGWLRYAFPGLALGSLFVARALHDLTSGFRFHRPAMREPWAAARLNRTLLDVRAAYWQPVWGAVTLLLVVVPLGLTLGEIVWPPFNAPLAMASYISQHVPIDARIATWEQEAAFLTDHDYAYPPQAALPKAVNHIWAGGAPVSEFYDFESESPDYVLVGPFGSWVDAYPASKLAARYAPMYAIEGYTLYIANR
jgi:4-amino-4-deoxy-L-arabinose transferase-like glycosyltransferase